VDNTVDHPDFLNPDGFVSPSPDGTTIAAALTEATGLTILTPAALAALLNSFSSLFFSFSFLSSAAFISAPTKPTPFAFAAISFIRAL
jgi:hypothetical protein